MPLERLKALLEGGRDQLGLIDLGARQVSATRWEYSSAGKCERPYTFVIFGRPTDPHRKYVKPLGGSHLIELTMETKCRNCEPCRKSRQNLWADRAVTETRLSTRTWFGTLTLTPGEHHHALNLARAKLARQGLDFDALPPSEQFMLHNQQTSQLVTKYLKRMRKGLTEEASIALLRAAGVPPRQWGKKLKPQYRFRYIAVAEAHESGWPHYHLLMHELPGHDQLRKLWLDVVWTHGFAKWRLVADDTAPRRAANYVCKYLGKDAKARVRASIRYGLDLPGASPGVLVITPVITCAARRDTRDADLGTPEVSQS